MLRLALLAALLLAVPVLAASVRTPQVEAELVAERSALAPGEPLTVALRLKMIPEWHTYWRNPGDSGEPTRLEWRLPPGFEASEIYWPHPRRLPAGPLMNYGYEGEVLLLSRIVPPRDLAPGTSVTLAARAFWLVCSREHCIPEDGEVSLTLPVASDPGEDPRWAKPIAAARAALPAPPAVLAAWTLAARGEVGGVALTLVPPPDVALRELVFFPFEQGKIEPAAPQPLARADGGLPAEARGRDAAGRRVRAPERRAGVAGRVRQGDAGARGDDRRADRGRGDACARRRHRTGEPPTSGSCFALAFAFAGGVPSISCRACCRCYRSRCSASPAGTTMPAPAVATASSTVPACSRRSGCWPRALLGLRALGSRARLGIPAAIAGRGRHARALLLRARAQPVGRLRDRRAAAGPARRRGVRAGPRSTGSARACWR